MSPELRACFAALAACLALPAMAAPAIPATAPAPAASTAGGVMTVSADSSSAASTGKDHGTRVIYSGHVVVRRGALSLFGDKAVIDARARGIGKVVVTGGPARFELREPGKAPVKGAAASITYTADSALLQLDGGVHLERPGETFSAGHAAYHLDTRRLEASGKNAGRVHAVLTPSARTSP